jgi:threonine/homoserine/homoserine lactone efflux protein
MPVLASLLVSTYRLVDNFLGFLHLGALLSCSGVCWLSCWLSFGSSQQGYISNEVTRHAFGALPVYRRVALDNDAARAWRQGR